MNNAQIESWVLSILDRLRAGQPIEDRRVELKSEFIDPVKAARRLAGHANASHGDPILWIFGLDGKDAEPLIGVESSDFGQWWEQVSSRFVELAPTVRDLNIPMDGRTVVALVAETDRAPYVVLNPAYGQQGAGPVESEVPWREGTNIRSARRGDLIQILVPAVALPTVDVRTAQLTFVNNHAKPNEWRYDFAADLYLRVPANQGPIIVPDHDTAITVSLSGEDHPLIDSRMTDHQHRGLRMGRGPIVDSGPPIAETAERGRDQLVIHASGPVRLVGKLAYTLGPPAPESDQSPIVSAQFRPVGADNPVRVRITLDPVVSFTHEDRTETTWSLGGSPTDE